MNDIVEKTLQKHKKLLLYGSMAIIIVLVELITFQLTYLLMSNYLISTVVSFVVGVILNWLGGRRYIFNESKHKIHKEAGLIVVASLLGLLLQIIVVSLLVEKMVIYPLFAKAASIVLSFVWNYWFRRRFVYTN